jgi:hypothetical protein
MKAVLLCVAMSLAVAGAVAGGGGIWGRIQFPQAYTMDPVDEVKAIVTAGAGNVNAP